jgi:UDP-GlcNAc:undecaprenyl-phosphate/decaprenyl-phosphate GlcNAc-1-phosphate transferase
MVAIKLFSLRQILAYCATIILVLPPLHHVVEKNNISNSVYLLVLSFLISYAAMPLLIAVSDKLRLVDHPDEARKHHANPTPVIGGLAIYVSFIITIFLNFHFSEELKAIVIASSFILFLGLADDIWGLSANIRLVCQVAASLYIILFGVHMTFVPAYLGGIYTEIVLTLLWLIGITNSMNFIDGMDGVASGSCIIYSAFFAVIAFVTKQDYFLFMALAIVGSCLGFFIFNFRKGKPALVFLGDSGATFLGFLLASFAILGEWGNSIIDIVIPVLIMSVLIFDMTLTTVVRIYTGEVKSFSQWLHFTGRDHFHHRLADLGISKYQTTWLFFGVSISFGIEALAILFANVLVSLLILIHSALVFAIIGIILVLRNKNKPQGVVP